ncbi:ICMT-domain-containing protein [Yamadazyma tenuis ATCC 10573]|uniref:Protein-S-isoprenylcysteine O-methyltransferase n=1 Tax=Candida tenuis (strain ATCC 10573 / BCRC 21748 / CBS 615 / JCM 9827 / NBRC 10315 / NRRL Y-1498 / VKM Y-70) TaxID=590646 RepID=G3B6R2_CANTC|nr:ICMT-domain-containing protein [Yamadazyma tenuis ATCC 10573]EGV62997.1 ICMT-domain-containing protein [Yamadazyma tenuis ATCC 10573]
MSYDPSKVNLTVVCAKSVALGAVISTCLSFMFEPGFFHLSSYVLSICIFHLLEFISTSVWNTSQVDDDSFILTDYDLLLVNVCSLVEHYMLRWLEIRPVIQLQYLGVFLMGLGQFFRTASMYTAKTSFNHYIQRVKSDDHVLVTHGVYAVSRHPSYFGFFWWFVGLRVYMNNWVVLGYSGYKIWRFFKARIEFEEKFLVQFFGDDYREYRRRVGTKIPFIA